MNFLSAISSYFSFNALSPHQEKVFSKFHSNLEIKSAVERQLNQFISDQLPFYRLYTATLKSVSEHVIEFSYVDQEGQSCHYRFANDEVLNKWLVDQRKVDIWEIEDHRGERPVITYKLQKEEGWGFDNFSTDQELFEYISETSGTIWKLINHSQTVYIRALTSWSGKKTFEQKNLEDLACFLKKDLPQLPVLDCRQLKGVLVTLLAFTTVNKLFSSLALTAMTTHSLAMKNGIANPFLPIGFSLLAGFVSQTRAQTLTVPSPLSIQVNPGDQVNLSLASYFALPADKMIGFYATPPSFLTLNNAPQFIRKINVNSYVQAVTVSGNILHTFGNFYQTFNLSSPSPQVLGSFGGVETIRDRVMHLNYAYLATGPNGCQVINATNPRNLTMVAQIPANTFVNVMAYDLSRSILWLGDGMSVKSVNMTNPVNPVLLNTFSGGAIFNVVGIGLSANNGVNLLMIQDGYTSGRLTSFNATNPANISYIGTSPSINGITYSPDSGIGDVICNPTFCFPAMLEFFTCNMTTTVGPVCYQAYGLSAGYVNKLALMNNILYVASAYSPYFYAIDATDPSRFGLKIYQGSPVNATETKSIFPLNDFVYVAAYHEVHVYQFKASSVTISGTSTLAQRGNYTFNVTATNFTGGTATLNVLLEVVNQGPIVANPFPPLFATLNSYFFYPVSNNTFSDADDPTSSLRLILNPNGLPFIFNNATQSIQGTPLQLGDFNMSLMATDSNGKSAIARIMLHVSSQGTAFNPTSETITRDSSSSSSNVAGAVVGVLFGGLVIVVLVGGTLYVLRRKGVFSKKEEFKLSPLVSHKALLSTFGGGNYGTLNWTADEVAACYKETGLIPELGTGKIGSGHFGAVSICWDIRNTRYAVMKIVDDPKKFQASIAEAELQKKAAGEGVWPIYNYIQDDENNRLVLLFPPAGLKDLNYINRRIKDTGLESRRQLIATFVAKDLLNGLNSLRDKKISHFDLKGSNVLVGKDGNAGISDFGCAQQTDKEYIDNVTSDVNYKSPEQLDSGKIYSKQEDLWATGLMILEFLLGRPVSEFINIGIYKQKKNYTYRQYVEEKLAQIDELQAPVEGSLFHVVKTLLAMDPMRRGTPSEALKSKCFSELDHSQKAELFGSLLPNFSDNQIMTSDTQKQEVSHHRSQYENVRTYENV